MRLRVIAVQFGLTACLVALLSGCGGEELDALQSDPMATEPVAGLEEVGRTDEKGSDGGVLGKPAPAQVLRIFELPSESDAADAFAEAKSMAVEAGWEISSVTRPGRGFVAEREVNGEPARLTVSINFDPDRGLAPGLSVSLSAGVD